jgi:hypothetical protein
LLSPAAVRVERVVRLLLPTAVIGSLSRFAMCGISRAL